MNHNNIFTVRIYEENIEEKIRVIQQKILRSKNNKTKFDVSIEKEKFYEFVKSIEGGVIVYSDRDVDGITSATIVSKYLDRIGINYQTHIADEYIVDTDSAIKLKEYGYKNVILLDVGTNELKELENLVKQGFRVLVIDHHLPLYSFEVYNELGVTVINPHLSEGMEFKTVSTGGLLYKLINEQNAYESVLAMLSTVADVQPVENINIELVDNGLRNFKKLESDNFLISLSGANNMSKSDLLFEVIPKINLLGKNKNGQFVYTLLKKERVKREEVLNFIRKFNTLKIQAQINKQRMNIIEKENYVLAIDEVMDNMKISGIANSLMVQYGKYAIYLKNNGDVYIGSARGEGIFKILNNTKHLFVKMGGHEKAVGFTIEKEKTQELIDTLDRILKDDLTKSYDIPLSLLTLEKNYEVLKDFFRENQIYDLERIKFFSPDTPILLKEKLNSCYKVTLVANIVIFPRVLQDTYNLIYSIHYSSYPYERLKIIVDKVF